MRLFKIFVAAVLLSVCGLAGSDIAGIINLSDGDEVNGNNFTVVGKGWDYAPGKTLEVKVIITDIGTGDSAVDRITVTTK